MAAITTSPTKRRLWTFLVIAVFIIPAAAGFINKFRELIYLAENEEHSFAIMPVLNYLLASVGFCFMLFWAATRGMFTDVERPKYTMMEQEKMLDELTEDEKEHWRGENEHSLHRGYP